MIPFTTCLRLNRRLQEEDIEEEGAAASVSQERTRGGQEEDVTTGIPRPRTGKRSWTRFPFLDIADTACDMMSWVYFVPWLSLIVSPLYLRVSSLVLPLDSCLDALIVSLDCKTRISCYRDNSVICRECPSHAIMSLRCINFAASTSLRYIAVYLLSQAWLGMRLLILRLFLSGCQVFLWIRDSGHGFQRNQEQPDPRKKGSLGNKIIPS